MLMFADADTQDFYDAWVASQSNHNPSLHAAYGAGWNAAMRAAAEARRFEEEQYRRSCED